MTRKVSLFESSSDSEPLNSGAAQQARRAVFGDSDSSDEAPQKKPSPAKARAPAVLSEDSDDWEPAKNNQRPRFSDSSSTDDPIESAVNVQLKIAVPDVNESDSSSDAWPSIVEQPKNGQKHAIAPALDEESDSDNDESTDDDAFDAKYGSALKRYVKGDIISWDDEGVEVPVLGNKEIVGKLKKETAATQLLEKLRRDK